MTEKEEELETFSILKCVESSHSFLVDACHCMDLIVLIIFIFLLLRISSKFALSEGFYTQTFFD